MATAPTQVTQYQTGIAPELAPFMQNVLGQQAARMYTYKMDEKGDPVLDESGMPIITGFQPYEAYGTSRVAGPTELQTSTYEAAKNLGYDPRTLAASAGIESLAQKAGETTYTPWSQSFTQPGVAQSYMNPYMQSVVDAQQREARRASEIGGQQQQAQAVGRGAFGGSRDAIMRAERERNLGTQLGDIQAAGLNAAYKQAMDQYNTEQQLGEQSRQYGAGLGLQGLQTGLTGYGTLANVGQNLYGQNIGNLTLQNQFGTQQQQQNQNVETAKYQDWLAKQNYPQQMLDTMATYVRGTPVSTTSASQYTAPPSTISQVAGTALTGSAIYNNLNPAQPVPRKKGGSIKENKPRGLEALALSKLG
jgi:hypothetical protein